MKLVKFFVAVVIAVGLGVVGSANAAPVHKAAKHKVTPAVVTQTVNINKADADALATLKGIGPKKAEAIVAYRNKNGAFKSVADLTNVRGISTKFIARLEKKNPGRITATARQ